MANPRKFSEKIALHHQKQAEETAAFEQIMREVSDATQRVNSSKVARVKPPPEPSDNVDSTLRPAQQGLGTFRSGSLPNVAAPQATTNELEKNKPEELPLANQYAMAGGRSGGTSPSRSPGAAGQRGRASSSVGPMRRPADRRHDTSPYGSTVYLSPPPDSNWRRTNSDSALHQSCGVEQQAVAQPLSPHRTMHSHAHPHLHPHQNHHRRGDIHLDVLNPMNPANRPRSSCEIPRIPNNNNVYSGGEGGGGLGGALGCELAVPGGSLPDLTSVHFPPPHYAPHAQHAPHSQHAPHTPRANDYQPRYVRTNHPIHSNGPPVVTKRSCCRRRRRRARRRRAAAACRRPRAGCRRRRARPWAPRCTATKRRSTTHRITYLYQTQIIIFIIIRICRLWTTGGYPPATRHTVVRPRNIPQRQILTYLHQRWCTVQGVRWNHHKQTTTTYIKRYYNPSSKSQCWTTRCRVTTQRILTTGHRTRRRRRIIHHYHIPSRLRRVAAAAWGRWAARGATRATRWRAAAASRRCSRSPRPPRRPPPPRPPAYLTSCSQTTRARWTPACSAARRRSCARGWTWTS